MKEIELKILNVNEEEIEKKLVLLGAKKKSDVIIKEKIFDFEDNRISKNNELFRLRKNGDKIEITYKYSKENDKEFLDHEEIETEIKDFEIMIEIIERLGLKIIKDREKRRISFILKDVHFEIDKYPEIPAYLEIEAQNKGDIKKLVEELGYSMKDTTSKTATQVLKQYEVDNSNFLKFK